MRILLTGLIGFLSFSAFANNPDYDLKIELSMNGKHVSSPRMVVRDGEMASLIQKTATEETFIDVVATDGHTDGHKGIMMKFVVGYVGADGQRTIVAKPQILARENEPAQITIREKDDKETVSLSVIAKRKVL